MKCHHGGILMEEQIISLVNNVQKLAPSTNSSELQTLVSQMSQRSGISVEKLLNFLYEELQSGIPFRYTSVGKSRSWTML